MTIMPDISVLYQIINFVLLIIALNYVLYRPIRGILAERQARIESFESDIERMSRKATDRNKEIESRLDETRKNGFIQKEELKNEGLAQEKQYMEEANKQAQAAMEKIKAQVSEEVGTARDALKKDLDAFSIVLAQKILGRSLS